MFNFLNQISGNPKQQSFSKIPSQHIIISLSYKESVHSKCQKASKQGTTECKRKNAQLFYVKCEKIDKIHTKSKYKFKCSKIVVERIIWLFLHDYEINKFILVISHISLKEGVGP